MASNEREKTHAVPISITRDLYDYLNGVANRRSQTFRETVTRAIEGQRKLELWAKEQPNRQVSADFVKKIVGI